MAHYIRMYFAYMKRSFISRMEYKKDTFIAMMGFFIQNAASIASIYFIVNAIPSLNGWSIWQLGFLYGFVMIPRGIDHLLTDDLWRLAYFRVKNGDLDMYFLRPVPVLFQVLSETFQPDAFGELIVGTVMLVVCGILSSVRVTFSMVLLLIVAGIFGALIITSLKILTASFSFVLKKSGPLVQVVYNFMDYVKYPISIFPAVIRNLLLFAIPFGVFISLPVETVYFNIWNPYLLMLWIVAAAVLFFAVSVIVWRINERKYESTGS
ncbi:MAG: ABC-2 family transporter protein [Clostridia bacterium]|nr:ABC-2 family transporter protein [Clostridia bacterium]